MARQVRFGAWNFYPDTHVLERGENTIVLEPRVARLLEYFLANPGDVLSHDQLVAFVWDDRVVSDDAIRRAVSALRHALAADGTDKLITTVPKKGYLANLPPAAAALPPPSASHRWFALFRPVLVLPMLLLALTLGAAGWWLQGSDPPDPEPAALPHTLAVLPFIDLSESAGNAYLADGVAEELLALLSRFSTFWIPARSSAFQFRGQQYSPQEVGKALGVRYLVEGSVRREADQVRINVRLIDAANGFQLWAGNYNRTLSGLFTLQEDIAAEVARALQVVLVQPDSRNTATTLEEAGSAGTEAYLEYLRARQLLASFATADLEAAITHLHNAIALAPEFAPAYTQLAEAMMIRANDLDAEQRSLARDTARPLIEKALELDPELGETYAVRARLHFGDIEDQQTEADLRRSIALSPSYSEAYERLAELLFFQLQREDEALELIDQARALDPLRPRSHHIKAYMMIHLCRPDAAGELSREALRVNPRFRSSLVMLGNLSSRRGELAQAVWYYEQALALDPNSEWVRQMLQMSYLDLDDLAAARQVDDSSFMAVWRERLFQNDPAGAGEIIYASSEADSRHLMSAWAETYSLLAAAMTTGDFERARRHLSDRLRFSGELPERIQLADLPHLLNMVLIWHGESDNDHARGLIERLRDEFAVARTQSHSCLPYDPIAHALVSVALGHNADAVALLQSALLEHRIFGGWYWILNMQPAFEPLLADPRFQVLQRSWEQALASQQAHLNQMRRDGRIPERRAPPAARSTDTAAASQNLMPAPTNQY